MAENQALLLQVSADTSKALKQLEKLQDKIKGVSKQAERLSSVNDNAIGKVGFGIGRTIGTQLDGLAGKAGVATTALSGFGAAGIAAAAAVGGLAAVLGEARKALSFADEIGDAAGRIGVTTDALQEYRYAIHQAGGETADADEALTQFTQTLGKAQSPIATAKNLKPFQTLGLDPKSLGEAEEALQKVLERLSQVRSEAQRQALAKALGLEKFIPLTRDGADGLNRLREEARKLGYVMDADLIKRAGEANDKLEVMQQIIDVQLKSAFVDLAPVVLNVAGAIASAARAVNGLAKDIGGAYEVMKRWFGLLGSAPNIGSSLLNAVPVAGLPQGLQAARAGLAAAGRAGRVQNQRQGVLDLLAGKPQDLSALAPERQKKFFDLLDIPSSKKGHKKATPRDQTEERTQQVNAELASSSRDMLQALAALTTDVETRAAIEKRIIDAEQAEYDAKIRKQQADLVDDKGISDATRTRLSAELEIARIEHQKAAQAQKELVDREAAEQKARDALSISEAQIDGQAETLQAQEGLARTTAERRTIELQLLDLADQRVRIEQQAIIDSSTASAADKEIARLKLEQLEATKGLRQAGVKKGNQDALDQYLDELPHKIEDVNAEARNAAANGLRSLEDGLVDLATGARSAKDVLRGLIRDWLTEITRVNIRSALGGLFDKLGIGGGKDPGAATAAAITTAGSTAGTTIGTAVTTAGASVATTIEAAIVAGGAQAASAIAAAMAAGGAGNSLGSLTSFASLFSGGSFSGGFNPFGDLPTGFTGFGSLGYANGTDYSRPGWHWVGENGPELLNFRPGGKVVPNDILRRLAGGFSTKPAANTNNTRNFSPVLNINVSGGGGADARRTAMQVGSETMKQLAIARKRGF